jgi:hypothetical protein
MLGAISSVMEEGDFLLLGVDFSVEDPESLKKTISSYEKGGARTKIDEFLCGPLHFGTKFEWVSESHNVQLITRLGNYDSIVYPVEVIHKHEENSKLSKVQNSVSLVRYQRIESFLIGSGIPPRMCDFSNKYSVSDFNVFIKNIKKNHAIPFEVVSEIDAFGISDLSKIKHDPFQQLVLLRYGNSAKNVDLRENEKRAAKETLAKVRERIKRIESMHKNLIPVKKYKELEAMFKENNANISRIIKLKCNSSKFPKIELNPSEESKEQCKKYLEKTAHYADLEDLLDE